MSRAKLALGLVVIAGAAILIAIATQPRQPSDSDLKATAQGRPGQSVATREKKPATKPSESDAILRNLGKRPGEPDEDLSNGPRMQRKQIKMH